MFKFLLYFCLTSSLTTVFCYRIPEIPELKSGDLISFIWFLRFSFHVNQFSYLYWCGIMSVNQFSYLHWCGIMSVNQFSYLYWCGIMSVNQFSYLYWCGIMSVNQFSYLYWCGIMSVNQFNYLYWCGIMSVNQWDWEDTWCFKCRCENICPKIEEVTYETYVFRSITIYTLGLTYESEEMKIRNGWGLYETR